LLVRFVIHNVGTAPLTDAWVGLYTELASGDKSLYSCWPPIPACGSTGGWYSKKWVVYEDSVLLEREHYCANQPVPAGCNQQLVPPWLGVQLLGTGAGSLAPGLHVTFAAWPYGPSDPARDTDVERYAILSAGTNTDLSDPSLMPGTGDPVELLA